jgi:uncharacterized protein
MTEPARAAGKKSARDSVTFRGHPMVSAWHPTTIEVTTEEELTPRGDCIIGVGADKGCNQLSEELKAAIRTKDSRVRIRLLVGGMEHVVNARGDPGLELSNPHEMVIRKSSFLSDRTVALRANAAARDIPRPMVRMLLDPKTAGRLEIEVG